MHIINSLKQTHFKRIQPASRLSSGSFFSDVLYDIAQNSSDEVSQRQSIPSCLCFNHELKTAFNPTQASESTGSPAKSHLKRGKIATGSSQTQGDTEWQRETKQTIKLQKSK